MVIIIAKLLLLFIAVLIPAGFKFKEEPSPLGLPIGFVFGLVACFL